MKRLLSVFVLGCAGVALFPADASAQFARPFGVGGGLGFGSGFRTPAIMPNNPFFYVPRYRYAAGFAITSPLPNLFGSTTIGYGYAYNTVNSIGATYLFNNYVTPYGQTGSYLTASPNTRADYMLVEQRVLQNAQREAGLPGAKAEITGQWNYEKGEPAQLGHGAAPALPEPVRAALAPPDRALLASGEALNMVYKEIVKAEAKGAKGPSGYIPPLLWEDLRFGGSPAGDLLNFSRTGNNLDLPLAFDDPSLAMARAEFEKDFASVALAVQGGKAPEAAKATKLEASFARLQDSAAPVIKDLPFEDATAARRFLNRMSNAIKALKSGAANGLIDPKWSAEGLTVADLVRHLTRHKLTFGAAPLGGGEAYATMHQHLATYLAVLTQPKK